MKANNKRGQVQVWMTYFFLSLSSVVVCCYRICFLYRVIDFIGLKVNVNEILQFRISIEFWLRSNASFIESEFFPRIQRNLLPFVILNFSESISEMYMSGIFFSITVLLSSLLFSIHNTLHTKTKHISISIKGNIGDTISLPQKWFIFDL